jgi:acyl transferase domain-containing protein
MSDAFKARLANLSPQQLKLLALELRARLDRVQEERRQPIAIVGIGCRLPGGVRRPDALWNLVKSGHDAIREVPSDRWDIDALYDPDPLAPGKMNTRWGGFLDDVSTFDHEFFGIAPREAASLDPQQRLLLEVTWEALEDAGRAPDSLKGSRTGVFVGLTSSDYGQMLMRGDSSELDVYLTTGASHSVASGRLSCLLGLNGPAVSIDTACSSSLVALHLACQSLHARECDLALAGGVNVMLLPEATIAMSKSHMMAPDGRCKTFDARANGFVRAEGCGIIALKRLDEAVADGDRILAVVLGSAVNQDGRSNGLTAPNGTAQRAVIRAALAAGGVTPSAVGYVEAHGTGTALGDPIEVDAIGAALGDGRSSESPVFIGAVKANLGHLEAAAGMAGVIKTVQMLRHGAIPPQPHFQTPNPYIDWDRLPVTVPRSLTPWPAQYARRIAGVSSFGVSGTNAHIVLAEPPAPTAAREAARGPHLLCLSTDHDDTLGGLATQFSNLLASGDARVDDVCLTAAVGRAPRSRRMAVLADSSAEMSRRLSDAAAEQPGVFRGVVDPASRPRVAFLFTGQGAQYVGMGRELYERHRVFREQFDACDRILTPAIGRSIRELLFESDPGDRTMERPELGQPALFAFEYALASQMRAWGIEPAAMMGHSLGEYVAACHSGVLSLEDGLALVVERGRLSARLPETGAMIAISLEADALEPMLQPFGGRVSIAAINGPQNTVISGDAAIVRAVARECAERGHRIHELPIARAFHSAHVEPVLDELERFAGRLNVSAPTLPIISNVTGELAPADLGTPSYWRRHLRMPVQFARAMQTLRALDCQVFIEVGPHPVLSVLGQHCMPDGAGTWVAATHREKDQATALLEALAQLYVAGVPIKWDAFYAGSAARRVSVPTYPFKRSRHWLRSATPATRPVTPVVARTGATTFPGVRLDLATRETVFETAIGPDTHPFLRDHRVHGALVVAAPVMLELARASASAVLGGLRGVTIEDFTITQPLVLQESEPTRLQAMVTPQPGSRSASIEIASAGSANAWSRHATGRVIAATVPAVARETLESIRTRVTEDVVPAEFYGALRVHGAEFGPAFQAIASLSRSKDEALARLREPADLDRVSENAPFHPVLLDACFQTVGAVLSSSARAEADTYLMVGFERATLPADPVANGWCHAVVRTPDRGASALIADITLFDERGQAIATIEGLRLRRVPRAALPGVTSDQTRSLYEIAWVPARICKASGAARSPRDWSAGVDAAASGLVSTYGLSGYEALVEELEQLSARYVLAAFAALGVRFEPGRHVGRSDLDRILPRFDRLVTRLMRMMVEDGWLAESADGSWIVLADPSGAKLADSVQAARKRHPAYQSEIDLLDACGSRLAAVLTGDADPLQLLFPGGSMARVEALTQASPAAQAFNALAGAAVSAAAATDRTQPLRILEIGAGTGGTTAGVIAALQGRGVEYCFTDVSPLFLARAAEKFAGDTGIEYARLDIEQPGSSQLPGRTFDLVVAANVLHATRDVRQALTHAADLLAPGGVIVLLEGVKAQRWVDLTFGLTDGWWRFSDERQHANHPLLAREQWSAALSAAGFDDVTLFPGPAQAAGPLARQAVIVGRKKVADCAVAVVAGDADGTALVEELRARDVRTVLVNTSRAQHVADVARHALGALPTHVVYVAPDATVDSVDALSRAVEQSGRPLLELVQGLARDAAGVTTRLWIVTRGAQPAGQTTATGSIAHAALWGLGRTIAMEHPELWGGLVDVDAIEPASLARVLSAAIDQRAEDELAIRGARTFVSRLRRSEAVAGTSQPALSREATYLVTGGTGGMGLRVSQWLAGQGAGHLVLLSRRVPDERAEAAIAGMRAAGAKVITRCVDVADSAALTALIADVRATLPPIRGVMHIAGVFDDRVLVRQDWERFERVLAPKLRGGWLLDRLTADLDLDFFVSFSSGASFLAPVGLANYAAANAFTDALAHDRRRRGRPAVAINWGPWERIGMAEAVGGQREQQWGAAGFSAMTAAEGLQILGRLMNGSSAQVAALSVEWPTYLGSLGRTVPFYADLAREAAPVAVAPDAGAPAARLELGPTLAGLAPDERWDHLVGTIGREVRQVLGFRGEDSLDVTRGLFALGMDSLTAVELKNRLQRMLGKPVPATVVFDHTSVTALGRYLAGRLDVPVTPPAAAAPRTALPARGDALKTLTTEELAMRLAARLREAR